MQDYLQIYSVTKTSASVSDTYFQKLGTCHYHITKTIRFDFPASYVSILLLQLKFVASFLGSKL